MKVFSNAVSAASVTAHHGEKVMQMSSVHLIVAGGTRIQFHHA
jgi:hypothetical protein